MPRLRRVIIESPYAATATSTVGQHVCYARACLRDSLNRGEAPLASHLLYTQPGVLDDTIDIERNLGVMAGLSWTPAADAIIFYIDNGISPGMRDAIKVAVRAHLVIEYRQIYPIAHGESTGSTMEPIDAEE